MAEHTSDAHSAAAKAPGAPPAHGHGHGHDGGHGHDHGHHDPNLAHHFDSPQQQFDAGKLGIWLFLLTEVLFFSGLFCAYTIYRAMRPEVFVFAHYFLDTKLGALNTCVLLLSSLTAAWAVRNAQLAETKKLVLNLTITILCACTFMVVKYFEYSHKYHDGLLPGRSFAPHQQLWEVPAFKEKHPEAAAYAAKLVKQKGASAHGAATTAAPAAAPSAAAPSAAAPSASAPVAAAPSAAAPVGEAAAPSAAAPVAAAPVAAAPGASAPVAAAPAAATVGEAAAPAAAAQPAPAAPAAEGAEEQALETPTKEQLGPLLQAGVLGPKAETPDTPSRPRHAHVFFSIYFFMTGLHGFHVLAGIGVLVWLLLRAKTGVFGPTYFGPIDYAALYWHLVDLIWIYLFPLLYLIH